LRSNQEQDCLCIIFQNGLRRGRLFFWV
jgi:hypothetical protein